MLLLELIEVGGFPPFLFYRKFLKTSEMVYNDYEIKMSITKERIVNSP